MATQKEDSFKTVALLLDHSAITLARRVESQMLGPPNPGSITQIQLCYDGSITRARAALRHSWGEVRDEKGHKREKR
jgi:hypothetical protein